MSFKKIPLMIVALMATVIFFGFINAEDDPIKKAAAQLEKWVANTPQEKVYLQLDKPYYAVGDDIWFKAYIAIGPKHELSNLSGALNVELIDDRDSVKQSIKLPVIAGTAYGDFALSDTLAEGSYRIRAYTNYMRNFGTGCFFDKTINIGGVAKGGIYTKSSFNYTTQNNQQVVTAIVTYQDLNGQLYANKEVNYQVMSNGKDINKGKGVTDANGSITISFVNTNPAIYKSGRIITRIKTDPKTTITKTIAIKAASRKVDVQFFPESGNLVSGLPSRVAFKAVGADGLGAVISGIITDDSNQEIAKITTRHLGMGSFILMPQPGKTYKAQITFADGSQSTINLPVAQQEGYIITVNNSADADNIGLRIYASETLRGKEISVVAQSGGVMCYAAKNKVENGMLSAKIPKSKFPTGIVQFTIFNEVGTVMNERLVFINRPDGMKLNITPAQQSFKVREKVQLDISTSTPDDKPIISTLSAAVLDETRVPVDASDETTILSSLLLSSELKGYIEKPGYYFESENKNAQADLDVLMLTQGYRRFEWKQLMNDMLPPVVFQPEKTLQISGRVHAGGNKPVVNGKVTLFSTKGGTFILDTLTDKDGRFKFSNLVFKDSIRFVIQARTDKNKKDVEIELDNAVKQIVTPNGNVADADVNVTSNILPYLQSNKKFYEQQLRSGVGNHNILLKEVVITEKRKPLENSSNLNGPGNADQVIKSDVFDKMACPTIADCLQGRVLGVVFRNGIPYSTRGTSGPMQIILDGVYVDSDILSSISQYDIGSIEILRSAGNLAIYGVNGGNGVMIINTKRGNEDRGPIMRYAPGVITYSPKGFYQARQFYSPQYDDPKTNTALADLRTTIYWKPNIVTDATTGKASISYFNAGSKGTYRVVVEGIDADGRIGRKVLKYAVE